MNNHHVQQYLSEVEVFSFRRRKLKYPNKTTKLAKVTDKFDQIALYRVDLATGSNPTQLWLSALKYYLLHVPIITVLSYFFSNTLYIFVIVQPPSTQEAQCVPMSFSKLPDAQQILAEIVQVVQYVTLSLIWMIGVLGHPSFVYSSEHILVVKCSNVWRIIYQWFIMLVQVCIDVL